MTMLRFLLILLLVLNALAFGAIKGWFGFAPPDGEPERISNQLHPERIKLLDAGTANGAPLPTPRQSPAEPLPTVAPATSSTTEADAAAAPDRLCLVWSGLNESDADRLSARLTAAGITPSQTSSETPSSWWVRIPPLGSRDAAERRVKELRAQGVSDLFIVQDAGPNQFAISLGLFKTEASSNQHLAQMRAKGVRGASIAIRSTVDYRIEVTDERAALTAIIANDALAQHRNPCSP
ncbi:SPOR domain-containing protein [Azoarcus sp. L1K30]|uniref:SPOR domain-containing protein n=1 Tax=Azoarcus sp. L1K30 TaxID=2820277 RepID=UPI001B82BACA|nr:SPOR domain-containing protein [Azoarcus sp. L1K30]MBR0567834.1 SPOR domain-containing protein [Azoarcus sp. L1K30]